jgi:hypothetical protein
MKIIPNIHINKIKASKRIIKMIAVMGFVQVIFSINNLLADDYLIPENGKLIANISDRGVNRIAVRDDRIAEVVGNGEEYIIESDSNLGQIFLTPVLKAPKEINIRLITEKEKIIDTILKIKNIEPQTLILKYTTNHKPFTNEMNKLSPTGQISELSSLGEEVDNKKDVIELIKLAHNSKLTTQVKSLACIKDNKSLSLLSAASDIYGPYLIIKAKITNKNIDEVLKEAGFASCMNKTLAIALDYDEMLNIYFLYLVGLNG